MATPWNPVIRSLTLQSTRQAARPWLDLQPRKCARTRIAQRGLNQCHLIHSSVRPIPSSSSTQCWRKSSSIPSVVASTYQQYPTARSSFSTSPQRPIFSWLFGKDKTTTEEPPEIYVNPYKAKRQWPPDMSSLSEKQQFRLERKYRRRAKLKYARPTWTKWTKLVQWTLIGFVLVYSVLFMEMKDSGPNPFEGFRDYLRKTFGDSMWSTPPPRLRKDVEPADNSPSKP